MTILTHHFTPIPKSAKLELSASVPFRDSDTTPPRTCKTFRWEIRFLKTLLSAIAVLALSTAYAADLAPALQWVTSTGGSGNSSVAAAAVDKQGNLYIVGSTTSLDFPTTLGTQAAAGGSTLARINLATGSASRLFPANLPPLTAAAAAPTTLYAAAGNQVFQSTDAGSTWSLTSRLPSTITVSSLAVNPVTPATLYAGTTTAGVQKSLDGGATWKPATNGIPPLPDGSIRVQGVWVQPASPNVIFASSYLGVARSADGGDTWTLVASSAFGVLAVDPLSDGVVYFASGIDISKSTNNGTSFTKLSSLPKQAQVYSLLPDPRHAGVVYAGTSQGVYQSTDSGATWTLKRAGNTTSLAADPTSDALYANGASGTLKSTDGFATTSPVGPVTPSVLQLLVSGSNLIAISAPTTDVFAVKLDNNGNLVYATYFGGSGSDAAVALAVGADGSIYVTGSTTSTDLPVTAGAWQSKPPPQNGSAGFVFKLNPAGSLGWATYFTATQIEAIAVDSTGNAFIGGYSGGGLPTTPGAYVTDFQQTIGSNGFFSVFGPTAAFITKFNATGSGLVYSTYVPTDAKKNTVQEARALAVDSAGNAWIGVGLGSSIAIVTGTQPSVVELNPAGSAVLASAVQAGLGTVTALALDASSNVYVAGAYIPQNGVFPATAGAFQPKPQPMVPAIVSQPSSGGGMDAFVAKWDSSLTLLAATLLGGEGLDTASSVAVDASGTVIVAGYTDSKALPTHTPFQVSFSSRSGFVAAFDSNLSNLIFSTYLGDERLFAAQTAVPDGNGNILIAGSTLNPGGSFAVSTGNLVLANKIALTTAPALRLDSVQNYASHIAQPLAPGEPIVALGAGFGSGAQIILDGSPLTTLSATSTSIVAVTPNDIAVTGGHTLQVLSGTLSNTVLVPAAAASPALYTADGSGEGQGYILNSDGTLNSPDNPAPTGSAITIFAAGQGQYSLTNGYVVTSQTPVVLVDGFYCNGVAATIGPVDGRSGSVYQLTVLIPDLATLVKNNPDLKNFKFPAQSSIRLLMLPPNTTTLAGAPMSQNGIYVNLR